MRPGAVAILALALAVQGGAANHHHDHGRDVVDNYRHYPRGDVQDEGRVRVDENAHTRAEDDVRDDFREDVRDDVRDDSRDDVRDDFRDDFRDDVRDDFRDDVRDDFRDDDDAPLLFGLRIEDLKDTFDEFAPILIQMARDPEFKRTLLDTRKHLLQRWSSREQIKADLNFAKSFLLPNMGSEPAEQWVGRIARSTGDFARKTCHKTSSLIPMREVKTACRKLDRSSAKNKQQRNFALQDDQGDREHAEGVEEERRGLRPPQVRPRGRQELRQSSADENFSDGDSGAPHGRLHRALAVRLSPLRHRDPGHRDPGHRDPRHRDPRHRDPRHRDPRHRDPGHRDPRHRDHRIETIETRRPALRAIRGVCGPYLRRCLLWVHVIDGIQARFQ